MPGVGPTVFSVGSTGHREVPSPQSGAGKEAERQGAGAGASHSEAEQGRLVHRIRGRPLSASNSPLLLPHPLS